MEYLPSTLSCYIKNNEVKRNKKDVKKLILYSQKMLEGLAYLDVTMLLLRPKTSAIGT